MDFKIGFIQMKIRGPPSGEAMRRNPVVVAVCRGGGRRQLFILNNLIQIINCSFI